MQKGFRMIEAPLNVSPTVVPYAIILNSDGFCAYVRAQSCSPNVLRRPRVLFRGSASPPAES